MIFSFSSFHLPFIEIQSRILKEQAYLFIYAFPALLIKKTGFSPFLHVPVCTDRKQEESSKDQTISTSQQYDGSSSSSCL